MAGSSSEKNDAVSKTPAAELGGMSSSLTDFRLTTYTPNAPAGTQSRDKTADEAQGGIPPEESGVEASRALLRLFMGLVLLSCTDKLSLTELAKTPGGDQSCLICDACVARSENTAWGVRPDMLLRLVDQRPNRKPGP